jgi:hypothetical protein
VKVGDLVRMKNWPHFEMWWGKTAIVHGMSKTDCNQDLVDVCFNETGEVRICMSASLFEIVNEAS